MRAAFIHSREIEKYHYPADCPFKTERAALTKNILSSINRYQDRAQGIVEYAPRPATRDELALYHTSEYLEVLQQASAGNLAPEALFMGLGTQDTPIFTDLYPYSVLAGGASLTGAQLLLDQKFDIVFNPSGGFHHAFKGKAGGFCYINDVVLAARFLANAGKRVFCLDLDAHHGDGTQAAFYDQNSVFTVSFHESGKTLFPWGGFEFEIGEGEGRGYNVNMPFPAGTDDDVYARAFNELVPPLLDVYKADIILLEIGMDILAVDPLTHLGCTNNVLAAILPLLTRTGMPLLVMGGGGYHPQATARAWSLAWCILCGFESSEDLSLGMGGVFLGSSEWEAGLRDMHSYATGKDLQRINTDVDEKIEYIKRTVFPIHNI
ncbi:MAG: hypothetical protein PHC61_08950 [Chitinivibrionales bacterium]|nr:hypothetical protein [Chitinivibrionales bacterium]